MINGYSLERNLAEDSFLVRELGVQRIPLEADELLETAIDANQRGEKILILVSNPLNYKAILERLQPRSVVLMQLSDENFSLERRTLSTLPSVNRVFRNYSDRSLGIGQVALNGLALIEDVFASKTGLAASCGACITGARMRQRQVGCDQLGTLLSLGYTNGFASAYLRRLGSPGHEGSLFDVRPPKPERRELRFAFVGGHGQVQRRVLVKQLLKRSDALALYVEGAWSRSGPRDPASFSDDYVQTLMSTEYGLCPPGWISNETFRVVETLLCGAIPLALDSCVTQGSDSRQPGATSFGARSWRQMLRLAASCDSRSQEATLNRLRSDLTLHLTNARSAIGQALANDAA